MLAHILFPKIDAVWPASLSIEFVKILRDELRYRGLIVSDDLGMKAIASKWSVAEVAVRALVSGTDLLLYCNEPEAPPIAFAAIEKALIDKKLERAQFTESTKRIFTVKRAKLGKPMPLPVEEMIQIVGHPDHLRLAQAIASGSVPADLLEGSTPV
jgi:beta-N-acetylhexosaminidase